MVKWIVLCVFFGWSWTLQAESCWSMTPYEVRDIINQGIMAIEAITPPVHDVCDLDIVHEGRTTPVRLYFPSVSSSIPIILMIHGGAWVAGNLQTHDNLARYLCRETESLVLSVGYQNAPEGKYPLPLEQCYDTLLWLVEHAQHLHADPKKLAVVGDSAGGNLAAALCLLARDRDGPYMHAQVLINPAPDLTAGGTLERQYDSLDTIRWLAKQYLVSADDLYLPYVSPSYAEDLSGLPQALVLLADQDPLFQDGQDYADRLCAAGVSTTTYIQYGSGHLGGRAARAAISAQESLDVAVAFLRQAFAQLSSTCAASR